MYNHAPTDYICPICVGIQGNEDERTMIRKSDIVYRDDLVTVFIGSFFVGNNPAQPIVVPNTHYENLYELPDAEAQQIILVSRTVAMAMRKSYKCDGVMVRQNNEPASSQHVFHYHTHLFPRFDGDELDKNMDISRKSTAAERLPYADKLREELEKAQH